MNENTFFQVSRSITRHPRFLSASHVYRSILFTILDYMTFEKDTKDDHGILINLEPGQLMATDRQIASWNGCEHYEVQRSLACFEQCGILRLEVRHKKRIITLLDPYICRKKNNDTAPNFAPGLRQDCAIKEEDKNIRNIEKGKIYKKETTPKLPKIEYHEHISLTAEEYDKLISQHGHLKIEDIMTRMSNWIASKGKNPYKSHYHAILNWITRENKIERLETNGNKQFNSKPQSRFERPL